MAGEGVRRGAAAMVRSVGAAEVVVWMPAPPVAGDAGEELGLRTPEFQKRVLTPVAVRRTRDGVEVIVAADVLEGLLGVQGCGAVDAAAGMVTAVQIEDEVFMRNGTETVAVMGRACLYRLLLLPGPREVM